MTEATFRVMKKRRMPKSVRKFIRKEKARIRREVLEVREQKKLIQEIYIKYHLKFNEKKET